MWASSRIFKFSVMSALTYSLVACTKDESSKSLLKFNRVISPLPSRLSVVDEEYRDKALTLNSRYYYLLGEYLSRKKDIKGALQAFERARTFDENEPEIYFSLAGIYLQLGKAEEAEALLRRTLELDPNHFSAMLDLAQLIKGSGSMSEVRELFARAAKLDPDSDEAVLGLVVIEMASKDYKTARKSLQAFIARKPESHLGHFYLGTMEQDSRNFAGAEKEYKKALELRPDFARAAAYLGQILESQKRKDEALKLFEEAGQYTQGAAFLKRVGEMRVERQEPEKAREAFEAYLDVDKENTEVMLRLAFLSLETKDYATAETYFRKVATLKPEFSSAYYFVGVLLEEKKDYKNALEWFKKVKPGSNVALDALKAMSRIYVASKKTDEGWALLKSSYDADPKISKLDREKLAVEMISFLSKAKKNNDALHFAKESIETFPQSEDIRYARSIAMEEGGDAIQGAKDLEYLIEVKKTKNPSILNFVGYVYADSNVNLDKAERYILMAKKLRPEDPFILDSLGWVYFKKGDLRSAETWLRKAAKGAPEEPVVLEHLADCLVKLGSLQEATEIYAKALVKGFTKQVDQNRLLSKHETISQRLQALCMAGNANSPCRVVREPRNPASKTD